MAGCAFKRTLLTAKGITVGGYTLGCFFGAVATIWLGNWLGRRKTIFVGSCIMIVGAAIQCSSFELGQLIASRLLTGFGNGMVSIDVCSKSMLRQLTLLLEYVHCTNLASRNVKIASQRANGHDRRLTHCLWCHDIM